MSTTDLKINGMTCNHCVASVTEELQELPGVTGVEVNLVAGGTSTATVTTTAPGAVAPEDLKAAVEEAGYAIATPGLDLA
ncbi:heavy-metal-associated domain-containing protein [Citricoccus nitrophenolicus]|uniref:Heavy-metal-associated domain-containing protein n=1 Tax=Citricoccus nitrophenolicus TaxID=863575 RepID=A0ABV0IJ66_9MICC|nr:heavy-metal-associated domain-containing protein [Citricoccus sp. I39-566]NUL46629.1 heavy-metal-associated domain-containing protein [Cellulosimicrobium funkei]WMY78653.1 heavy-metal-associated domain-containing protein [Citricoccus sp. I39-566]